MKILADENLYDPIVNYLRSIGHDVLNIKETNLSGSSDDKVYKLACNENRVIVTMDKDFTRIFRFPPSLCGGIIVVKIYRRFVSETLDIFKKYYEHITEKDITKNLVIITPEGVRIRRTRIGLSEN